MLLRYACSKFFKYKIYAIFETRLCKGLRECTVSRAGNIKNV